MKSVVILAVLLLVCSSTGAAESTTAARELKIRHRLPHGVARPQRSATLRFLVPGAIASIDVREGQELKAGTSLVSLDDRLSRARLRLAEISASRRGELKHAEVQLRFGEKQLARLESLFKRKAVSEVELEEQRALVERAQAVYATQVESQELAEGNREFAEEQLRHMTIFAPFDCVVTELHQKVGASVNAESPVVSVANLDVLEVELHAPVRLYGSLRPGDTVELDAREPVNRVVQAEVLSATPVINAASGTFRCTLVIDNPDGKLPAGFAVSLR